MIELSEQQQRIVAHNHGPALVFAVAGAGKTTAMVRRVERLVRDQVFAPEQILVSSFNKAAVDDISRALAHWEHCRPVARQTLHALSYQIVRDAARRGFHPPLARDALKTGGEERQLLWAARDLARQRGIISGGELDALDEQDLLDYIGACKGNLHYPNLAAAQLPPDAASVASQADAPPALPWYLDLYRLHEELRRARGWLTFDDMLLLGWELLARAPELRAHWQGAYAALIVDEYQDVNLAQSELIDLLAAGHGNIMAVGDDDQTIYGFRGASMRFFHGFAQRYRASVYEMTDNFRCQTSQVVLANRVIAQNRQRHPKTLVATQGFGGATLLRRAGDAQAMGRQIAEDIAAALAGGHRAGEIAVLVRLTAQTPPVEQALIAAGIPYRIAGDEPFFRRREVVDLLKYPQLAALDADLRAGRPLSASAGEQFVACWQSIYNRPKRYLPRQLYQETVSAVVRQGRPLSTTLRAQAERAGERMATALRDLADLLVWLDTARAILPAELLLAELDARLGYQKFLARSSGSPETGASYAANVAAFMQYASGRGDLAALTAHLAELEAGRAKLAQDAPQAVDIRTIHRAKGLEWPVVLLPHCNAGYMPFAGNPDIEEERRLLYVAITRARRQLHLYTISGGGMQPSPLLVAAGAEAITRRATEVARLLSADPRSWTAAEALSLTTFPRAFGQERFFTSWWRAPDAERARIAGRVLTFVAAAARRKGLGKLGVDPADVQLWQALAPGARPAPTPPFAGMDDLRPLAIER